MRVAKGVSVAAAGTDQADPARTPTAGRRRAPDSYTVLCAAVGVWAVLLVWQHRWGQDIRLHYATVYALVRDLWQPGDPMVGGPSAGPYFSPYLLVLALLTRAGTAAGQTAEAAASAVFGVAALVNTGLLLWGVRRFSRHLSPRPAVATLGLVLTLVLWGWNSYAWSGLLDLRSLSAELPYPSMLGLALMFLVWDALLRYRDHGGAGALATLTLLSALLVLTHPFTAVNTAIGAAAFVLGRPSAWRRADLAWLAAAGAVVALLAAAWPYSDPAALFRGSPEFTLIHEPLVLHATGRYVLALVGLPALLLGLRRPLGRELALMCGAGVLLFGYARYGHAFSLARALPLYGLPLHLALARHLADPLPRSHPAQADRLIRDRSAWRRGYLAVTGAALAVGVLGALAGVLPAIPGRVDLGTAQWRIAGADPDARWRLLTGHLHQGEVVMAGPPTAGIVNRYGMYSVAPAWPDPFVPDEAARRAASARFLSPAATPEERLAIADRYRVRCLITRRPFDPAAYPTFRQVAVAPLNSVLACRSTA